MNLKMLWNVLLVLILFLLFASLFGFYSSIRPPKIISGVNPKDLGLDYEQVTFTTADTIKIAGWWIPSEAYVTEDNPVKTIILLHGYPADKGDIWRQPLPRGLPQGR